MARPDLYRVNDGSALPQFDVVRPDLDIKVIDGKVYPNGGGVSVFAAKDSRWPSDTTFVVPSSLALPPGLFARHDRGTHWILRPSREMTLEEFKAELSVLNTLAVAYDRDASATSPDLPAMSNHKERGVRFIYEALVVASRERIAVDGFQWPWNDNDYAYLLVLASELHTGALPLNAVAWDPKVGWTREVAFLAHAVHAYMVWTTLKARGNDDLGADAMNDNSYLGILLGFEDEGNPYSHFVV